MTTATMIPKPFRVVDRRRELHDTWTIDLAPLDGPEPRPAPGQYDMLYAFGVGEVPISVAGLGDGVVTHTIRDVGAVTGALCRMGPGDVVGLRGPFGRGWDLDLPTGGDVLVVAGGIGLAPLRPVILHALDRRDRFGNVAVCVGARSPDTLLYEPEIHAWRGRFDAHVEVTVDTADPTWRGHVGLVTELLGDAPVEPSRTDAFVCGPEVMTRFVAQALVDRGLDPARIQVSLERNMKCAVGRCGHCQLGGDFVCLDGPVATWERVAPLLTLKEV